MIKNVKKTDFGIFFDKIKTFTKNFLEFITFLFSISKKFGIIYGDINI